MSPLTAVFAAPGSTSHHLVALGRQHGREDMPVAEFVVRAARAGDARAMAEVFAAVAQERDGIATEPPVDIGQRAAQFARGADASVVAVAGPMNPSVATTMITRWPSAASRASVPPVARASSSGWA